MTVTLGRLQKLELPLLFVVFGASSVFMTLLNKQLVHVLNEPFTVLVLQNIVACVFGWTFSNVTQWIPISPFNRYQALLALIDSILFSAMICSSMYALSFSSTALVVVFRNSSPLLMSLMEHVFLGGVVKATELVFLLCTLGGAFIYSLGDLSADRWSFFWCSLNLVLACSVGIVEKWITTKLQDTQTSAGVFFLRNLFSAALLIPVAFGVWMRTTPTQSLDGAAAMTPLVPHFTPSESALIFFSCVFGYLIGFTYFLLQRRTTPVSISVANCTCKLLTVAFGFVFFKSIYNSQIWIGLTVSFLGSFGYTYECTKGGENILKTRHLLVIMALVTITGSSVLRCLSANGYLSG